MKSETNSPAEAERQEQLQRVLREYWGYETFRPLQQQIMLSILAGKDSLVVMPTGGGKSLCYQAPALCQEGTAVIISPLISLMKDQVDAARTCGIPAAFLNSAQDATQRRQTLQALRESAVKLIYLSPERIAQADFLAELAETPISFFAIDEAHCVSQWGHDFRPQYRALKVLRERFPGHGIHAFTATATESVRRDVADQLGLAEPGIFVGNFDRPNLRYRVQRKADLAGQLLEILERHRGESGIVYCITRKDVEQWTSLLAGRGYRVRAYHAGLEDAVRNANQEDFIEDRADIVVATVAFGMGIDKSNVRFVVHAGMPQSLEHYQQESGRAGRDGLEAECCLIFGADDAVKWQRIFSDQPEALKKNSLESLRRIMDFCEGSLCRHRAPVRHFGQDLEQDCGSACDLCADGREEMPEALVLSQKILSSVHRQKQRFGAEYTALVLRGSRDQRIIQNGHDQLSTFGLLQEHPKEHILGWIGQLVQQEFLCRAGEYNVLQITENGSRLLRGDATPRLLRPTPSVDRARSSPKTSAGGEADWDGVERGSVRIAAGRAEGACGRTTSPAVPDLQ